ncbi:DNA-directed RNA polymerase specialized sigma24 family protein [Phycicoccus badiiscoriae]|uniref:DNA-directed RNA polymerase specialized sigma24 family protein n=1 Tax=Pedococcus badiiscoriae TaxID=642776 RepID=A0A852WFB2_9MICO|nr:sigma factor-like helix-turn-helix DNA-binding protein [Pedococcus badiiscoriae]NYG07459.1 DNA-directed RNA polymerase specialized sigma24 family protein [Pedococcus badiiscoriae]
MADRFAEPPSFDEYVVARGADLLRTAWLLVGDDRGAEDLVRATLVRSWPQWHHLSDVGAGSYDAELRRSLVATYLRRRWRPRGQEEPDRKRGQDPRAGPGGARAPASGPPTKADVLRALDRLSRRERAVLVLWSFDGLSEAQVADALDEGVAAVHRHRVHALETVLTDLALDEDGLRATLADLPPQDPSVDGLVGRPRSYAGWRRGVRGWALAGAGLVAVALVGGLVSRGGDGGLVPSPGPSQPVALACRTSFGPPTPPVVPSGPLSLAVAAVLVCAQTDEGSVWIGSLPPDAPVSAPLAVDSLVLRPRTGGTECAPLPQGPAFRLVLQRKDGSITTYANEGMACNGWPALASYYVALAEQSADPGPGPAETTNPFLGCPSLLGRTRAIASVTRPSLPRGTVLEKATACLHPRPMATTVPRYVAIRGNVLGAPQLAQLNADLAAAGSSLSPGSTCTTGSSLFVVRAMTRQGRLVELSSDCADRFTVDWQPRDSWPASAETRGMLHALLTVSP